MSVDPENAGASVMNPQTWNGYAYVGNNPLAYVDPTGLLLEQFGNCYFNRIDFFVDGKYDSSEREFLGCQASGGSSESSGGGGGTGGGGSRGGRVGVSNQTTVPPLAANNGCVTPSTVQSAVIPAVAATAKFWNKTLLFGLGGSGGVGFGKGFGLYGSVSVQIAVSPSGAAAYVITFAAPAAVTGVGTVGWLTPSTKGAGFLGGSQFGFSNATDPSQLAGPGIDASGSLAAGIGIGTDSSLSIGGNFPYQFNVTLGFGAGGRGAAGSKTNTTVVPICHN